MMRLAEAAAALGARASGADALFTGVSTDSRAIKAGDLFVALRGERFDGHDFLKAVATAKAAAAMVDSRVPRRVPGAGIGGGRHAPPPRRSRALLARALLAGAGRDHRLERQDDGQGNARRHLQEACE